MLFAEAELVGTGPLVRGHHRAAQGIIQRLLLGDAVEPAEGAAVLFPEGFVDGDGVDRLFHGIDFLLSI